MRYSRVDAEVKEPTGSAGPAAPEITLPKGGGAIRGIGENFSANPVTGTGSMSVPIATSAGRSGFGPNLALSYDSGAGNGPFGMGWSLSLPAITRKTDKGLPKYRDRDDSDVFTLSGSEDLVPAYRQNADGSIARDSQGRPIPDEEPRDGYLIKRFRPRTEGLFARIERWTRVSDGDAHWRSISKDNVLTVYGSTTESRIADPDPARSDHVFSWLICQSYDDKGNAISYEYVAENGDNVDRSAADERNRVRSANRYLKYIRYGNRTPLLVDPAQPSFRRAHVPAPDFTTAGWMFEVVFDYGEGHYQEMPPDGDGRVYAIAQLTPQPGTTWPARQDPFSSYRAGFEVRSYRLCRQVLMFHHFPEELGAQDYLVRSTLFALRERTNGSFITQVVQAGYKRQGDGRYLKSSLPPLEFAYSSSPLDDLTFDKLALQDVGSASLRNLPAGIDTSTYRWVDLDGEGIAGVLTEQANHWYYKPNLGEGSLGPIRSVRSRPSSAMLNGGRQQLLDLAGDGNLDLVELEAPIPGFFPRTDDADWDEFRTFPILPSIDWMDPNLRFVDLTGDGHADILITEDQAYTRWHESLAGDGFGPSNCVNLPWDEENGPRVIFADGTQSIYLADMSGDGLTDLVRVRNGEVCYWPNIGYGRFGPKVTMDHSPWFDSADLFDQRRVHLADTDGSGPTDIIYFARDGVQIYLNQHGNSLSAPRLLTQVPRIDSLTTVSVVDFLGRGTACLLWSSPLPGEARRPLRYLDLMGGIKPHLLTLVRNNLGAETQIDYASSTSFYLADKAAGKPWVTRLPFPVHVVARVETRDRISGNRFVTRHTYHHGHYDGIEREFRGFARVEQWDTEEFGVLNATDGVGTGTNLDASFYVPPVLTKTWFHTGAYRQGKRISRFLEDEYYREGDPTQGGSELTKDEVEAMLLDDTVLPDGLAAIDMPEAVRALKGGVLRQEVYAVDGKPESDRPYSVSERNYTIELVQPRESNRHAVFFTHARETIDFHYERKLYPVLAGQVVDEVTAKGNPNVRQLADPRVTHALILDVDVYGNVRQSLAIAHGRRFKDMDAVLTDADRAKQQALLVTLTDSSFTNAVVEADAYRAPLPAETQTYELIRFSEAYAKQAPLPAPNPDITNLFRFDAVKQMLAPANDGAIDLPYEDVNGAGATQPALYRRRIERLRTRYRSNDLAQFLPVQALEVLALPGESYKLAFTPGLLNAVFQRPVAGTGPESLLPDPTAVLPMSGGIDADRGGYLDLDGDAHWWLPSGRSFFHPDESASAAQELSEAVAHFFMPRRIRNAFGHSSFVDYDKDLLPNRTRDAIGNTVSAVYDYRVLQPRQLIDPNGNRSFTVFDVLGMPVAAAVSGKASEALGDSLAGFGDFDADPTLAQLQAFVAAPREQAASLLKGATRRFVYDLDRYRRTGEPPFAAALARETHVSDLQSPPDLKIQTSFAYSDGFGRELQSKIPAEPGLAPQRDAVKVLPGGDVMPGALQLDANGLPVPGPSDPRWVGKGRTVFNNKGKPVKQYEPFFSSTHLYDPETQMTDTGVTPILFYDPVGRVVATLHSNHTYEKVVFDAWSQQTWDVNDTVAQLDPKADADVGSFFNGLPPQDYLPTWYDRRRNGQLGADEQNAATRAAAHAGTPGTAYLDALGRTMLTVADNGVDAGGQARKYPTRVELDIESTQRTVRDAVVQNQDLLGRVVMRYDYDMLGHRIHQASMEAGERWMLNDVSGQPIRAWDSRGHNYRTEYDALRRPLNHFVLGTTADSDPRIVAAGEALFERIEYGEGRRNDLQLNLRTRPYKQYDAAGIVTSEAFDFKGNLLRSSRELLPDYKSLPDWTQPGEVFRSSSVFDALNRAIQQVAPHSDRPGTQFNITRPGYNVANLLERVDVWLSQTVEPATLLDPQTANLHAVLNLDYNAKGQRERIDLGNGASTTYTYDPDTFRLTRLATRKGGQVFQDLSYVCDPVGNITHTRDDAQQTIYFNGGIATPSNDYLYDPIYRLIAADGREFFQQAGAPEPSSFDDAPRVNQPMPGNPAAIQRYCEEYQYDEVGNFLQLVHRLGGLPTAGASFGPVLWKREYSYLEASSNEAGKTSNRLSRTAVGSATELYAYDAHGDMTLMPHLSLMQWDFKDQLQATARQVVNEALPPDRVPETTFYIYDSTGQRVRKVTERQNGSRKSERNYFGGFEVYREYESQGSTVTLERETLHVMDDKQRVVVVETRTVATSSDDSPAQLMRYQFGDRLGSASLELDDQAKVVSYEEYSPYGSTSYQALNKGIKASAKRYRYTGKERDEETGFTYHGARYYAPWLGRWFSCDPSGLVDGSNLYRYTRASPVVYADDSGCDPVSVNHAEEDDKRLKALGITRQQLVDFATMPRGDFIEKYGVLWYAFRFPTSQVRDLPSDLLYRVLPKSDQTQYQQPSGRVSTDSNETARTVQNFNPGTPLGGVASVAARGAAAVVGASREDTEWVAGVAGASGDVASAGLAARGSASRGIVPARGGAANGNPRTSRASSGSSQPAAKPPTQRARLQAPLEAPEASEPSWYSVPKLDAAGRPTQIEAVLKQSDMQVGARPSNPATLQAGTEKGIGYEITHLGAHELGFPTAEGNLTTASGQTNRFLGPVETRPPTMRRVEMDVMNAVRSGQTVHYRVTAIYDGNAPYPSAFQMQASGSGPNGIQIDTVIRNWTHHPH